MMNNVNPNLLIPIGAKDLTPRVLFRFALLFSVWGYFLLTVDKNDKLPEVAANNVQPIRVSLPEPESAPVLETKERADQPVDGEGRQGKSAIKIEATYKNSARVLDWLLSKGARILLFDSNKDLFAEVNDAGRVQKVFDEVGKGKPRRATAEITAFAKAPLPFQTKYAVVWWPDRLWLQIMNALEVHRAQSAAISYRVEGVSLLVRIIEVVNAQGKFNPDETIHIR